MDIRIDKRIFKFVMRNKFKGFDNDYLWFEKDFIFVTNVKSLLVIPCKNEFCYFGLEYLKLKEALGHKNFKNGSLQVYSSLGILDDYWDNRGTKIGYNYAKCIFQGDEFVCRKLSRASILSIVLKYLEKNFKHKIVISQETFKKLFLKNSAILINGNKAEAVNLDSFSGDTSKILFLTDKKKFNGLEKNKGVTLYYDELGKGGLYKVVQGDLILFEMGVGE